MTLDRIWAISATAVAVAMAVRFWWLRARTRRFTKPRASWTAPSPDPGRYQVVMHYNGEVRELFHGYDALKARHAFELAPMEAGVKVEFYEWGKQRGEKSA